MSLHIVLKRLLSLFFLLAALSCSKRDLDDNSLFFFHYQYAVGDYVYDHYHGRPGRGWGNGFYNSGEVYGNVVFSSLEYREPINFLFSQSINKKDDNVTMFEFVYKDYLGWNYGWRWFINAPYINDGEKYYYDSDNSFLKSRDYVQYYPQLMDYCAEDVLYIRPVVSGWMSFTREVADSQVLLRVEFEADIETLYPRYGEQWVKDSIYTYHIRDGRLDFSTKMKNKIIGIDKVKNAE